MPKFWLPLNIKHKNKTMIVLIPNTGDRSEMGDIIDMVTETTKKQLEIPPKTVMPREDVIQLLKDQLKWIKKQKEK